MEGEATQRPQARVGGVYDGGDPGLGSVSSSSPPHKEGVRVSACFIVE